MTIREHIRRHMGETYVLLTTRAGYDGTGEKPELFGDALSVVMERLFLAGTNEEDITSEFVKSYVAIEVCREVIPGAIDYFMQRTGTNERLGTPMRGDAMLVAEARTQYNRVNELRQLDKSLAERQRIAYPDFVVLASQWRRHNTGPAAINPGPTVSTSASDLLTEDPQRMAPAAGGRSRIFRGPFTGQFTDGLYDDVVGGL